MANLKPRPGKPVKEVGKNITEDEASEWVQKYQEKHPISEGPTWGWLYGRDILEKLLEEKDVEGIWFYKALKDGEERLVLYPADEKGNKMGLKMSKIGAAAKESRGHEPADDGQACPPICPPFT